MLVSQAESMMASCERTEYAAIGGGQAANTTAAAKSTQRFPMQAFISLRYDLSIEWRRGCEGTQMKTRRRIVGMAWKKKFLQPPLVLYQDADNPPLTFPTV